MTLLYGEAGGAAAVGCWLSQTPYGTLIKLSKLRFYVSAAIPYNKPVYFEAAMERWVEGGWWMGSNPCKG